MNQYEPIESVGDYLQWFVPNSGISVLTFDRTIVDIRDKSVTIYCQWLALLSMTLSWAPLFALLYQWASLTHNCQHTVMTINLWRQSSCSLRFFTSSTSEINVDSCSSVVGSSSHNAQSPHVGRCYGVEDSLAHGSHRKPGVLVPSMHDLDLEPCRRVSEEQGWRDQMTCPRISTNAYIKVLLVSFVFTFSRALWGTKFVGLGDDVKVAQSVPGMGLALQISRLHPHPQKRVDSLRRRCAHSCIPEYFTLACSYSRSCL